MMSLDDQKRFDDLETFEPANTELAGRYTLMLYSDYEWLRDLVERQQRELATKDMLIGQREETSNQAIEGMREQQERINSLEEALAIVLSKRHEHEWVLPLEFTESSEPYSSLSIALRRAAICRDHNCHAKATIE